MIHCQGAEATKLDSDLNIEYSIELAGVLTHNTVRCHTFVPLASQKVVKESKICLAASFQRANSAQLKQRKWLGASMLRDSGHTICPNKQNAKNAFSHIYANGCNWAPETELPVQVISTSISTHVFSDTQIYTRHGTHWLVKIPAPPACYGGQAAQGRNVIAKH